MKIFNQKFFFSQLITKFKFKFKKYYNSIENQFKLIINLKIYYIILIHSCNQIQILDFFYILQFLKLFHKLIHNIILIHFHQILEKFFNTVQLLTFYHKLYNYFLDFSLFPFIHYF